MRMIREKSLIKHKEIYFNSIAYTTYVKEMENPHTEHTLISDLFVVAKSCGLRREGRRFKVWSKDESYQEIIFVTSVK